MFTPYIIMTITTVGGILITLIGMIYASLKAEVKANRVKQESETKAFNDKLVLQESVNTELKLRVQKVEDKQGSAIEHLTERIEHVETKIDKMQTSIEDLKSNIHKQATTETGLASAITLLIRKLDRDNQNYENNKN